MTLTDSGAKVCNAYCNRNYGLTTLTVQLVDSLGDGRGPPPPTLSGLVPTLPQHAWVNLGIAALGLLSPPSPPGDCRLSKHKL